MLMIMCDWFFELGCRILEKKMYRDRTLIEVNMYNYVFWTGRNIWV